MKYENLIKSSFKKIRDNLKLFIPDIIFALVSFLIVVISFYIIGLLPQILSNPLLIDDKTQMKDVLLSLFSDSAMIIKIGVLVTLTLIFTFLFKVYTNLVKYKYITGLLKNKKAELDFSFNKFKDLFYLEVLVSMIIFMPALITLALTIILISFSKILAVIAGILFVLSIIFLIITIIVFFFKAPIMFIENRSAIEVIRACYLLFKKKYKQIIILQLIVIAIGMIISLITMPLELYTYITSPMIFLIVYLLTLIIGRLIKIIALLFTNVFVFSSYKEL